MKEPRHILITGASSGLGAALALAYAEPSVFLSLQGRNPKRLEDVAALARKKGATVYTNIVDVRDRDQMETWLLRRDDALPVDLVIANAGVSGNTSDQYNDAEIAETIISTNVLGVANTVHPIIPRMKFRGQGQIALVSSLAGYHGTPHAAAYCASKAAVRVYGESLRASLAGDHISVNVVCPGFVKTPMTALNRFPMPFMMTAEKAAKLIRRKLEQDVACFSFPFAMTALVRLYALMVPHWPFSFFERRIAALPRKKNAY